MKPTSLSTCEVATQAFATNLAVLEQDEPDARAGLDPEAVHRMRVATRRLRAALRVFAPPDKDHLRSELAWLAGALGGVRDLDVQMASIQHIALPGEAISPLLDRLEVARQTARANLLAALDTERYHELRTALRELELPDGGEARRVAPQLVRTAMRRFRKAAARTGKRAAPEALHRARIRGKQLRYTLEFVADLYEKPAHSLIRRVVAVQDVLGMIQDSYAMQRRLEELRTQLPPTSVLVIHRLQHAYGQQAELARAEVQPSIKRVLGKRWRRLERAMDD